MAQPDEDALDGLSSAQLHHMAMRRARRHLDVPFFWNLMQLLPTVEASTGKVDQAETNVLSIVKTASSAASSSSVAATCSGWIGRLERTSSA